MSAVIQTTISGGAAVLRPIDPVDKVASITEMASAAIVEFGNDVPAAAEALLKRLKRENPEAYKEKARDALACWAREEVAQARNRIRTQIIDGEATGYRAPVYRQRDIDSLRTYVLSWFNWPLLPGVMLRDATRTQINEASGTYLRDAATFNKRGKWLAAIAERLPDDTTKVSTALTEDAIRKDGHRVRRLQEGLIMAKDITVSVDGLAETQLPPIKAVPPVNTTISEGAAILPLSPMATMPRPRKPSSGKRAATLPTSPNVRMPPLLDPVARAGKANANMPPTEPSPSARAPSSPAVEAKMGASTSFGVPHAGEPSSDRAGHCTAATHASRASRSEPSSHVDGHNPNVTQPPCASSCDPSSLGSSATPAASPSTSLQNDPSEPIADGGVAKHDVSPNRTPHTPAGTITEITEAHYERNSLITTAGDLQRRVKARCRTAVRYSTFEPADIRAAKMKQAAELFKAVEAGVPCEIGGAPWVAFESTAVIRSLRDQAEAAKKVVEKRLIKTAKTMHIAAFVEATPGFGWVGAAQIIGEAGDLGQYSNPAKLWKRMGLGLISSGERQQKFTDKAKAIEAGYNPRRRSTMFVIGDSMIKAKGPYRELYLARKAFEVEKAVAAGKRVLPAAKIPKKEAATCMSEGHVHIRAQRYMEKRLLRDLWRAWRGQVGEPSESPASQQ